MITLSKVIGNHAFWVRDGDAFTVPGAGTTSRTSKPGATDTSWNDLGIVKDAGMTPGSSEVEIFAPTPGQLRRYDIIETKRIQDVKISLEEISPLVWEIMWGTLPLANPSVAVQYNPLSGVGKKGWLKMQQYGNDDALFNTIDLYCHVKVDGEVKFDDKVVSATLHFKVLHSTLNTGNIA